MLLKLHSHLITVIVSTYAKVDSNSCVTSDKNGHKHKTRSSADADVAQVMTYAH